MKSKKVLAIVLIVLLSVSLIYLIIKLKNSYDTYIYERYVTPTPLATRHSVNKIDTDRVTLHPDHTPSPTAILMRSGNAGENIKTIQLKLLELGYYKGDIDGQFGPATKESIMWFQKQHKLASDGIVGPDTYRILFSNTAEKAVLTPSPMPTNTPAEAEKNSSENYLILVNKENKLDKSYVPNNLIDISSVLNSRYIKIKYPDTKADYVATLALNAMLTDAYEKYSLDNWQISSAYRSYSSQKKLFDNKVNEFIKKDGFTEQKAINATKLTVAEPGASEHQTGLAFDITVPGKYFVDTDQSKWMAEHCWDYGFILRYTKDKESITGIIAEPWHFRYVGIEHSKVMRSQNQALEEYLATLNR